MKDSETLATGTPSYIGENPMIAAGKALFEQHHVDPQFLLADTYRIEAFGRDSVTLRAEAFVTVPREVFERAVTDAAAPRDWDRVHDRPADICTPPEDRVVRPVHRDRGL